MSELIEKVKKGIKRLWDFIDFNAINYDVRRKFTGSRARILRHGEKRKLQTREFREEIFSFGKFRSFGGMY